MITSMTGYAAATRELPTASLAAEVKSVNGRFLDVQFRLSDELRAVEPALRELIQARVGRGKVECRVSVTPPTSAAPHIHVNEGLLAGLAETSKKIRAAVPDARPLSVGEVLHWPGVLGDDRSAALREACVALVREVLEDFAATRSREGGKLAAMLIERAERMKSLLASIQPKLPEAIAAYQEKLAARLREVLGGTDEERIRQEIALYGVKVDVAEELNRLGAHLEEVHRVVSAGGAVGKRLDFLMQELNREANTLGSKSVSKELSDASLELKLLIEQMREQIQNIE
ncbi:MAG TPA: YicC/YloC family endoribonuclease [Burkholderiales bacterium]|nr:YicC/YloC family endoribonuclease [Burkholderiales bacterium]